MKKLNPLVFMYFLCSLGYAQTWESLSLESVLLKQQSFIDSIPATRPSTIPLSGVEWSKLGFEEIEPFDSAFQYSIYGCLLKDDLRLVLVERTFAEENIHWACLMTENLKLLDHILIAYDNMEGFLRITSKVSGDRVVRTVINEYENPQTTIKMYTINSNRFNPN
ncbi:MAG: hypothetical protein AAF969_17635 [Bacteroidota bacterium]